ncbi:MAG: phosphohydrolase [Desulfobacterales bacterium]|jgi:uncharacterized protein
MKTIDPIRILSHYYPPGSATYDILLRHGDQVAAKALAVAEHLQPTAVDETLLYEAAMLHDIGIFQTHTPSLGCHGDQPYICHGILGRQLLEGHGLTRHALVCERHVGVGISPGDIRRQQLPLPVRDMRPQTIEEEIICYADKFYSKNAQRRSPERSIPEIIAKLERYGAPMAQRFQAWVRRFDNGPSAPRPPEETE